MSTDLREALARAAARPSEPIDVERMWRGARRHRTAVWGAASCVLLGLVVAALVAPRPLSVEFAPPADDPSPSAAQSPDPAIEFDILAADSPGIRAGALTYAATAEALAVTWQRYELAGDVPELDWSRQIAVVFGSTGACTGDPVTVEVTAKQVSIHLPARRECLDPSQFTTLALALPRERLPEGEFTVAVASPDGTQTSIAVDLVAGPAVPIGALPSPGNIGRFDAGYTWPPLAAESDLSPTCPEIAEFLGTPLPYLPDPPAGLQPPDCYLEGIELGAPAPDPGAGFWHAHVIYLPVDADPAVDGVDVILERGGLWYAVRFTTAAEPPPWPETRLGELAGGIVRIEVRGARGFIQSGERGPHMAWAAEIGDSAVGVLLTAEMAPDELVAIANQTELGLPPVER